MFKHEDFYPRRFFNPRKKIQDSTYFSKLCGLCMVVMLCMFCVFFLCSESSFSFYMLLWCTMHVIVHVYNVCLFMCTMYVYISQRGDSPFVYRDRDGWPASLPYICKIRVSVAIGTQSGIRLHKRVPMVKIWGSSKNDQSDSGKVVKIRKVQFSLFFIFLLLLLLLLFRFSTHVSQKPD